MASKKPPAEGDGKHYGLRLNLGNAPDTPHTLIGLPGFYSLGRVTPVGGTGEATVAQARDASDDDGAPVELVEITAGEVAALRAAHDDIVAEAVGAIKQTATTAVDAAEIERVNDEAAAAGLE